MDVFEQDKAPNVKNRRLESKRSLFFQKAIASLFNSQQNANAILDSENELQDLPTQSHSQIGRVQLYDLPSEILKIIIYHLYRSKSSIIPLIVCCKYFYKKFSYLIYITKIVHIRDDQRAFFGSSQATCTLRFLDKNQSNVAAVIPILSVKTRASYFASKNLSLNNALLFKILPSMSNLVVLTLDADEPRTLFQSFLHFPPKIQVLKIFINFTKRQISHIDPKIFPKDDLRSFSRLEDLQYFEVECRKYKLVTRHIYPALGSFITNPDLEERRSFEQFFRSKASHLYDRIKLESIRPKVKDLIGRTIFNFLQKNRFNLIKMEFMGIDLSLIFNTNNYRRPFTFDNLRMLFFDNNSRLFMTKWLPMFHQANQTPTRGLYPLLVFYDRLGQRLYYKDTRMTAVEGDNPLEEIADLSTWRYSDKIASAYNILNRKRAISY